MPFLSFLGCQKPSPNKVNELANVGHKTVANTRTQLQKSLLDEINDLKNAIRKNDASCCVHSSLSVISCVTTALTKSLKWMSFKASTIN